MITTLLLVAAAVFLLGGKDLVDKAKAALANVPRPSVTWQQVAAVGLLIAAIVSFNWKQQVTPGPMPPAPTPDKALDLDGLFAGPTAAEDAQIVEALCGELADEIAWDGTQDSPRWKTGVAIDELRQSARELRCRGVSIGARQPAARDAIAKHLEAAVGTSGGPIDAATRAAWVKALREVSEAAADVTR
jgi:hypothetical protein